MEGARASALLGAYYDAQKAVVTDLGINQEEFDYLSMEKARLGLVSEQVRVLHARVFANAISEFGADDWLDDAETAKLKALYRCLTQLGWAPGQ